MPSLKSIKLRISEKLRNPEYRVEFFAGLAQDEIAQQIKSLRATRKLRQVDVAEASGMKQSAVSRLEQADYSKWNFTTLLRLADALDARIRVVFEPAEDVISYYERMEAEAEQSPSEVDLNSLRNAEVLREHNRVQGYTSFPHPKPIEADRQSKAPLQFGGNLLKREAIDESDIR